MEGVLHLANQFLFAIVEGECVNFLKERSKGSALFKYRLAVNYGLLALKVLINLF